MNRARCAFAATLVGVSFVGAVLIAQTPTAPPMTSVLAGKKLTPPIRGQADVDYVRSTTKRDGNTLVTKIQVKNASVAPIPRLTITETWYDKNNNIIPGGQGVVAGLLQPGEVQTVEIRTPSNAAMARSMLQFSHANGSVKPHAVSSFDAKQPATKAAAATKKAPAKKK